MEKKTYVLGVIITLKKKKKSSSKEIVVQKKQQFKMIGFTHFSQHFLTLFLFLILFLTLLLTLLLESSSLFRCSLLYYQRFPSPPPHYLILTHHLFLNHLLRNIHSFIQYQFIHLFYIFFRVNFLIFKFFSFIFSFKQTFICFILKRSLNRTVCFMRIKFLENQ